jgi:hypothetical protein
MLVHLFSCPSQEPSRSYAGLVHPSQYLLMLYIKVNNLVCGTHLIRGERPVCRKLSFYCI